LATPTAERSGVPGELPPQPPGVFFGRDDLVEKIVGFAQRLTPIALIGAGGIGKTSTVLTVLHDDRIKRKFGDDRRFIRCDQFSASHTHFLRQLSRVIGAGIENPEDLAPLRQHLSSKEMLIVLDNAESILDPQGSSAQEIYAVVDELSRFSNICLCITSRISTIPPHCETLHIPTLSMEAGCDTFYRIYKHGERSDQIDGILKQLDFHPLSITLLATVAQYNTWDANRLSREWGRQRTGVLHAQHSGSLAATIELSLASPMFRELGPDARGLLGVIAFFPQGVNEENIDWLFPTISDGPSMFDAFCILSLTYRSNGFITMLAPLRDHLRPKDSTLSPLLNTTKECYFSHMSTYIYPGKPGFEESRWITSEDVNIEHLLDILTSMDASSEVVWDASSKFMNCLFWHRPRLIMLGPKIEALPDDHPTKPQCLYDLSKLFYKVGNFLEQKRLVTHSLKLSRERGNDSQVALKLRDLCEANRFMNLYEEGIQQGKEALEIFERLGDTTKQAQCLVALAHMLYADDQLDAAEEAASRAIDLLPEEGDQLMACLGNRILGQIYGFKGDTEKAIYHFEVALDIASSLNLDGQLFWVHYALAHLFLREGKFDDAHTHIENAKSHTISGTYNLGLAMGLQAEFWYGQGVFEKARSEASHAADVFEKLGAARDLESCRELLRQIDEELNSPVVSDESDVDGELLETPPLPACINVPFQGQGIEWIIVASISSERSLGNLPTTLPPYLTHPYVASFYVTTITIHSPLSPP